MPAVLIELAFITNPGDGAILTHDQDALARAVARGITDYEQLILGGK
jgi:N-acetylmuramoyl-L-alanine amidase